MKKIKKLTAIVLTMIILLSTISMSAFAFQEDEFDINDITWDEIMTMSNSEFRQLLSDFEREYDPFGTYNTTPLTGIYETDFGGTAQPYWTSGKTGDDGLPTETGSHELITARACGILLNDKGFWGGNESGSIIFALMIALASIKPDREWLLGPIDLYKGHFYDPDTGKNWANSSLNTAYTNTNKFYDKAKAEYSKNQFSDKFFEYVGKSLHYVQDASEPHHAANIISTGDDSPHSQFEKYADRNLNTYIDGFITMPYSEYDIIEKWSIKSIVDQTARSAKKWATKVNDCDDKSAWSLVAEITTTNAVRHSIYILYKLSNDLNLPMNF